MTASNEADITWSVLGAGGAEPVCYEGAGGTVVTVGPFTDRETELFLTEGDGTRYDLSQSSFRLRWLNSGGGTPFRADTTDLLCHRFSPRIGGCAAQGLVVGNCLATDNRDGGEPWTGKDWQLYPRSHGGHYYIISPASNPFQDFTVEYCRSHGTWDPYRIVGDVATRSTQGITIRHNWDTLVRDDWGENDSPCHDIHYEDNLIGDTITPDTENGRGCWTFLSSQHSGPKEDLSAHVFVERNLVWGSQQFAPGRPRGVNGFACGSLFKMGRNLAPRHHIIDNFFVVDHASIGGDNGNPLLVLFDGPSNPSIIGTAEGQTGESSGNIIYYRDLAGAGKYAASSGSAVWDVPPGFTLVMGQEGEDEWNLRVANFKAAHPQIRRINNKSMPRPVGPNIIIDDVG